jgi:quinolinate synthase
MPWLALVEMLQREFIVSEIERLKKEKSMIVLAHYYQDKSVQDVADYIGDSLGLSIEAQRTNAKAIVFAGVHFMAETAKILNPRCKVLLPDMAAGCSLSDACPPDSFREFILMHPDHVVVSYINCSAEIKAESDIICTSANAEKVIRSIPIDEPIIFAPDKNLGNYLIQKTGRKMLLWDGACVVHEAFSIDKILVLHQQHPQAKIIAHPESEPHLLRVAHFVGSTTALINFVKKDSCNQFIVATEAGILHEMAKEVPGKLLIPAPAKEDNTCACSECGFMKLTTVEKVYNCMLNEYPEIEIEESLRVRALRPILQMVEITKN